MINAAQSYRQAQVTTVGRAEVTLMLFDGLLRFLDLAAEKMEEKNIQEKGNYISRALDIINELDSTLNMEKGGEVARGLHNLYVLTNKNLLMSNLKNDIELLRSVRANMQTIRDSFFEAMQTPEAKQALAQMGPAPQAGTSSGGQLQFGGSIQERANRIKEAQQRVDAINRAKKKLETATNDSERAIAKAELESLLGSGIVKTATKPVSASMAQKANRAFMQQQSAVNRNVVPQQAQQVLQQQVTPQQVTPQTNNMSPLQRQSALLGQNKVAPSTVTPSQSQQVAQQQMPEAGEQNIVTPKPVQSPQPNQPPQASPLTNSPLAGGLLSKKMALYKNTQS